MRRSALLAATAAVLTAGVLASCAVSPAADAPAGDGPLTAAFDPVIPAPGEVLGQGTVLQLDGGPAEFCLGGVAESYPPQCSGPELVGWDWAAVEGEESASGVTWGAYAVTGTWDGERMTATSAVLLALYDPMAPEPDPLLDPENAGASSEDELLDVQQDLHDSAPFEVLVSSPQNGYLLADVVYDDGRIQAVVDETYGPRVVAIRSVLRDL